jgi:predicted nucleic acid-binding protein
MTFLVADTCTLINFAVVYEMDLLEATLRGRSAWTQAVHAETSTFLQRMPVLKPLIEDRWLGEPIELDTEQDYREVHRLRARLGGTTAQPRKHLGEAESIHALLSRPGLSGAALLTDDRDAAELARRQGLAAWDTPRLLRDGFDMGAVGHPAAYQVLVKMRVAGRGVLVPQQCTDICPA